MHPPSSGSSACVLSHPPTSHYPTSSTLMNISAINLKPLIHQCPARHPHSIRIRMLFRNWRNLIACLLFCGRFLRPFPHPLIRFKMFHLNNNRFRSSGTRINNNIIFCFKLYNDRTTLPPEAMYTSLRTIVHPSDFRCRIMELITELLRNCTEIALKFRGKCQHLPVALKLP